VTPGLDFLIDDLTGAHTIHDQLIDDQAVKRRP
jgi:hypothetical protein